MWELLVRCRAKRAGQPQSGGNWEAMPSKQVRDNNSRQPRTAVRREAGESFGRRWLSVVAAGVAVSFLVVLGLLLRLVEHRLFEEHRVSVLRDRESIQSAIISRVQLHKEYLEWAASKLIKGGLEEEYFCHHAGIYMDIHPDVAKIELLEANFDTRWVAVGSTAPEMVRSGSFSPDSEPAYERARDTRTVLYTPPYVNARGEALFKIVVPAYKDELFLGLFVASCPLDGLLDALAYYSPFLPTKYQLSMKDDSGRLLAELSSEASIDKRFSQDIVLDAVIPGVSLFLVPYDMGLGRYGTILKWLAMVLALGLSCGIWVLSRDIAKRKKVEQDLRLSREELRSLAAHLQSVREEERARMSREVHDELGGMITAMKVSLSWLGKRLSRMDRLERSILNTRLAALSELVDTTLKWVRKAASDLRPQVLDDFGIVAALEWQVHEFQKRMGIRCKAALPTEEIPLDSAAATALFRICQESLTNVARYAHATRVDLSLRVEGDAIAMEVRDNGRGIDEREVSSDQSFGILGMQERAAMFGGNLDIDSWPGKGCTVSARIPFIREHEAHRPNDTSEVPLEHIKHQS